MNSLRFYIIFFSFTMFQISAYGMTEQVRIVDINDLEADDPLQIQFNHLKEAFNRPTFDQNGNYCGNLDNPDEVISIAELQETEDLFSAQPTIKHLIGDFESLSDRIEGLNRKPVLLEGYSRDERLKLAKLLAARAQCKYRYVDVASLLVVEDLFLHKLIDPIIMQSNPCVIIVDRFMGLLEEQKASAVTVLCKLLDDAKEKSHINFIALRGNTSPIPERLEARLTKSYLKNPHESMCQTIYKYLFEQPADS